jgi:hypothetical protein
LIAPRNSPPGTEASASARARHRGGKVSAGSGKLLAAVGYTRAGGEAEMVTKDLLKAEIDKVPEEHLGVLYRIVRALEEPAEGPISGNWTTAHGRPSSPRSTAARRKHPSSVESREATRSVSLSNELFCEAFWSA